MIDGLISGRLYGAAQSRTAQNDKAFVTGKVRVASGDGDALFVNVIAFDDNAKAALLALADGDSLALAGTLTPKVWTDKHGEGRPALDMVAHAVLTVFQLRRKREAVAQVSAPKADATRALAGRKRNGPQVAHTLGGDSIQDDEVDF